jgi:KaiC/GvpD/RAD55 family RecA-like ATPase
MVSGVGNPTRAALDSLRRDAEALLDELAAAGAKIKGPNSIHCPFHADEHASSGIYQVDGGIWKFKCHACNFHGDLFDVRAEATKRTVPDVVREAAGPQPARPPATSAPAQPEAAQAPRSLVEIKRSFGDRLVASYEYTDPDTRQVQLVVFRLREPDGAKTFYQARPEPGGFILKRPPDPLPVYNRTRLRGADRVLIVEGEGVVHALHDIGIVATTSPMGAGKAGHADWSPVAGKTAILWPDNDSPGIRHMQEVATILEGVEPRPTIYRIDPTTLGVPIKGDVVDYLAPHAGESIEARRLLVEAVLQDAEGVGPAAEVEALIEDTISGRRRAIDWPWPNVGHFTKALLPGTVTVICGDSGARKTFLLLQGAAWWHEHGVKVAVYELEEDRAFHLHRVLAQRAGLAGLTDDRWVRQNPGAARAAWTEHQDFLDSFGRRLWVSPDEQVSLSHLAQWVEQRAAAGGEIIAIDPVTGAAMGEKPWIEDLRFLMAVKATARRTGCRIVLVTHFRKRSGQSKGARGLDDLAGGAAYQRFSQTVLSVERLADPKGFRVRTAMGPATFDGIDCVLRIAKARNACGAGLQLAYTFDPDSLCFCEHGVILRDKLEAGA